MKNLKIEIILLIFISFTTSLWGQNDIPKEIPNLELWLTADSLELNLDSSVSKLYDLSQNDYQVVQNNTSEQPLLQINTINGHPSIYFNGANYLTGGDICDIGPDGGTIFIVGNSNNSSGTYVAKSRAAGVDKRYAVYYSSGVLNYLFHSTTNFNLGVSGNYDDFELVTAITDFSKQYNFIRINSEVIDSIEVGSSYDMNSTYDFLIGAYNNSSGTTPPYGFYLNGSICEILIYNQPLSTIQIDSIENYLNEKYNPKLDLGGDKTLYGFGPFDLETNGIYKDYLWSTGEVTRTISAFEEGIYSVTVTDNFGNIQTDSISLSRVKIEYPISSLDTTICFGDSITWDTRINHNYTFEWKDTTHNDSMYTITNQGQYAVKVLDSLGYYLLSDTISVIVDSFPLLNRFAKDSLTVCKGESLTLDQQSDDIDTWLWNTGSTNNSIEIDTSGLYEVTVENPIGCKSIDNVVCGVSGIAPIANFNADTVCLNSYTSFFDLSQSLDTNSITSWYWDFGNGDFDSVQNPLYAYAEPDTFNVTLSISNTQCDNSISKTVIVKNKPKALFDFRFIDSTICQQANILFENMSFSTDSSTLNYLWDFGDETSSNEPLPIKLFSEIGDYLIQLKVTQDNECSDSVQKEIKVVSSLPLTDQPTVNSPKNHFTILEDDSVKFSWNYVNNAAYYQLVLSDNPSFTDTLYRSGYLTDNEEYLKVSFLKDTIYWKVLSFNACNEFVNSEVQVLYIITPSLKNKMFLWFHSDSLSVDNGLVNEVFDLSHNSFQINQENSSYQPELEDSIFGKHPGLHFDGNNDYLYSFFDSIIAQPNIIIVLWKLKVGTNNPSLACDATKTIGRRYIGWYNDNVLISSDVNLAYNKDFFSNPILTTAGFNSSNSFIRENSILQTTGEAGSDSVGDLFIGKGQWSGGYLKGNIAELIFFDTLLSNNELKLVEDYIYDKYAPPVNLLYDIYVPYGFPDTTIATADKGWFTDFQWSTGPDDTLSTLTVSEEGTYAVTVTDIFGFESSDSLRVFYPEFNVWNDRSICLGDTLVWDLEPKGPYAYAWSTGSSDSAIAISEAGIYSVTITDTLGNSWSPGPVTVSIDSFPATATLGPDTTLCSGNRLELAVGQGEASQFLWHDGSTQPYYLIDETETIGLEVTNTLGCVAHDTITVDVAGTAPRANYSFDRLCRDIGINFTNLSEAYDGATITNYNWNFNETGTSNEINPGYTFTDTGEVAVTLTVETNEGCANDTTQLLSIHELPQPAFNPLQVCENSTLQLQNQSVSIDGAIVNYNWQINGNNYNETAPTYTFNEAGATPVQLVAITEHDCPDTLNTTISVRPAPNASFAYDTACAGQQVSFNNLTTTNLGQQYSSQWDFEEAESTARHPKHTFNAIGNYNINLVVTQLGDGCTDTVQKQISVHALPTAIITDQSGCEGTPHELQHASTWGEGEQPGTTTWLIADTSITGEPAFYTTNETGTKQIKLIAQNAAGCMDTSEYEYTINESPSVSFANVEDTVYVPVSIELANLSDPASWEWKLNDTFYSDAYTPTINFDTAGTYIITLTGTDDNGCYNIAHDTTEALVPFIDGTLLECRAIIDQGRLYVSVEMANTGSKNITNPELRLTLSNGQMFAETYSGIIYPGKEETYSFRTQYLLPDNTTLEWIITELIYESDQAQANNSCTYIFGEMPQIFNPYPNPVDGTLHLDFTAVDQGNARLRLYNLMGEIVMDRTIEANKGLNRLQLPNPSPNGGVHTLEVTVNSTRKTFRIVL